LLNRNISWLIWTSLFAVPGSGVCAFSKSCPESRSYRKGAHVGMDPFHEIPVPVFDIPSED
jgi:hypothetical protein